jgi:hypothetical protein
MRSPTGPIPDRIPFALDAEARTWLGGFSRWLPWRWLSWF